MKTLKDKGAKFTLQYFRVIPILILSLLLLMTIKHIGYIFADCFGLDYRYDLYYVVASFGRMLTIFIYIIAVAFYELCRLYKFKTGRMYFADKYRYHQSYFELVETFEDAEPHKLDTTQFPTGSWRQVSGLIFGKDHDHVIAIPPEEEVQVAVFGCPGSGKSVGIALPCVMQWPGSVIAVDIKGDLYSAAKNKRDIHYVHIMV